MIRFAFAFGALAAIASAPAASAQAIADPGERAFSYCYSCHTVDRAETASLQGPLLAGIVGRRVAAQDGFAYSDALKAFAADGKLWTPELLLRFIDDPAALVPGTAMQKPPGPRSAAERSALIDYLKKQH